MRIETDGDRSAESAVEPCMPNLLEPSLRVAIAGVAGQMGQAIVKVSTSSNFTVVGGTESPNTRWISKDVGMPSGVQPLGLRITKNVAAAAENAEVWIDFTSPEATLRALEELTRSQVRAVIVGTTGFDQFQEQSIEAYSDKFAIVRSGNFSLGVTVLAELVRKTASMLGPEWDIEISETHHRRKVDAPSGTALMLGTAAATGRGASLEELRLPLREGHTGPREVGGIGFAVLRGGGVQCDHHVNFISEREVVTLSHRALDRTLFAEGALAAARWAADKPPGLYSMRDVLGF
jgi:4-hydroxy-tetrahydrodipicolinate reductase